MTACDRHMTTQALLGHMAHMTEKLALQSFSCFRNYSRLAYTKQYKSDISCLKDKKAPVFLPLFLAAKGTICLIFQTGYSDVSQTTRLLATSLK